MARVRQAKRAGGHVLTPHGWRLVSQATPDELGETDQPPEVVESVEVADEPVESSAALDATQEQRDREECPDCGKEVAINKDGTLRKHTCVIEAAPPEVTFEEGEGDGGDSASEGW